VEIVIGVVAGLILAWLVLALVLVVARPRGGRFTELLRLLPDSLRLLRGLLRDPQVPIGAKARIWLLLGYLAMPIDLIPDFIPGLGYADGMTAQHKVVAALLRTAGCSRMNAQETQIWVHSKAVAGARECLAPHGYRPGALGIHFQVERARAVLERGVAAFHRQLIRGDADQPSRSAVHVNLEVARVTEGGTVKGVVNFPIALSGKGLRLFDP